MYLLSSSEQAYPAINDASHCSFVRSAREAWVGETSFHREGDFLEPIKQFMLLATDPATQCLSMRPD